MRVTTWNIRGGGGVRLPSICERLAAEAYDLCVLTEFRSRPGEALKCQFSGHHVSETNPPLNQNGVLTLSKMPLVRHRQTATNIPISAHRWLCTYVPDNELLCLGVHIPNQSERWNKDDFWNQLCAFAKRHRNRRVIILGDFNTGLDADTENEKFLHSPQFQSLLDLGWADCYRAIHGDKREYSWYSPNGNNGYRLDHCFISRRLLPSLIGARFDHDVRTSRLSDHSLLSVDLAD